MSSTTEVLHHCSDETITDRVLAAVAEETDTDPAMFDQPLYEVVDPDALNSLFRHGSCPMAVEFRYLGCQVSVTGNGAVAVTDTSRAVADTNR